MDESEDRDFSRIAHDPLALESFYRRHVRALIRFAARRSSSPEEVADLVAGVFVEAIASADSFTVRGVIYVYPKPAGMSDGPACASIGASLIKEGSFGGVGLAGIQAWYWDVTNQWAQAEEDSTEAGTCLDLGRVTQLVQRSFSAHGLLGWRILVVPRGEHATGDCTDGWSVSFATRTVQVLLMG